MAENGRPLSLYCIIHSYQKRSTSGVPRTQSPCIQLKQNRSDQTTIHVDDEVQQTAPKSNVEKDPKKPLYKKVTYEEVPGNNKNSGGSKRWTCNHYKGKYTNSYTRIHVHFFGPPVGITTEIKRCLVLVKSNPCYDILYNMVKEAQKNGVAAKS
uniref:Uncharacterized protein n=1 Tax=Lactuca sativa TaxID=4236 RepID=A0A9R1VYN1_LACSA|nr:hypothetical protein LSAT_V11C400173730 [Lactuca sativa]